MSIYEAIGEAVGSTARDARTINERRINPEWGACVPEFYGYMNRRKTHKSRQGYGYEYQINPSIELSRRKKIQAFA